MFWLLLDEAAGVEAPRSSLQVETVYEITEDIFTVHQLISSVEPSNTREQRRLVQRPAIASTSRLYYSRQVGLGDVQTRQPHYLATSRPNQSRDPREIGEMSERTRGYEQ